MTEHKSEKMMQTALAHGWKAQVKPEIPEDLDYNNIVWNLYCIRGKESLHVVWIGDRQDHASYAYGEHRTSPAHKGAVLKLLTGKPDPRKLKGISVEELTETRSVPWSSDSPAIDIMLAILGKEITWIRKIDGEVCRATVDRHSNLGKKCFRVYESPPRSGQRVLDWMDSEGFHAVRLDAIIDVA